MLNWQFDESKNTLFLQGRIDAQISTLLEKELHDLISRGKREIFIDCADVDYMSSAGLRVFLSFQKQLKQISGGLVLCRPSDPVLKVFKLSGFYKLFDISFRDEKQAEKSVSNQTQREQRLLHGIPFEWATRASVVGTWSALASKDELKAARPDVFVTISSQATQAVFNKVKDIPIVFATVANPFILGVGDSDTNHPPNITGVYGSFPTDDAMKVVENFSRGLPLSGKSGIRGWPIRSLISIS